MSTATEMEFKGNPMLVIKQNPEEQYPFQFGVRKAKLMLNHLEEVRSFVRKHER